MPHLSDSQVTTYESCPLQWKAQKLDAVTSDQPSEALILGSAFHNTLEIDGRQRMKRKAVMKERELLLIFASELEKQMRKDDPSGKLGSLLPTLKERGEAMIRAYHTKDKETGKSIADRYWPISVEEQFDFPIPGVPLDDSGEPWTFTGRVDARTLMSTGEFAIMDWKTASKPWKVGDEHNKGQATAYLLADLMTGRPVAGQVTFVTFPTTWNEKEQRWTCAADVRVTRRTMKQVSDYAVKLRQIAREIMEIKQGVRDASAHPHWRCPFCPHIKNCYDGLQWMAWKGKIPPVPTYPDGTLIEVYRPKRIDPLSGEEIPDDDELTA